MTIESSLFSTSPRRNKRQLQQQHTSSRTTIMTTSTTGTPLPLSSSSATTSGPPTPARASSTTSPSKQTMQQHQRRNHNYYATARSSWILYLSVLAILAMVSLLPEHRNIQTLLSLSQQPVVSQRQQQSSSDDSSNNDVYREKPHQDSLREVVNSNSKDGLHQQTERAAAAAAVADDSSSNNDQQPQLQQQQQQQQQQQPTKNRKALPKNPIKQISILGERNSGTRWTFDHISKCFNSTTLPVKKHLTRYKHWFQYKNPNKYPHDTLVLAQFRNPYDWFKAMEHVPHHSPAHMRLKVNSTMDRPTSQNDWRSFLTKPWTTERLGKDLLMLANNPYKSMDEILCQEDFAYRDIVSCAREPLPHSAYKHTLRYSEHQPFYEMRNDGSGEPYDNILQLRTDKIRNFMSVRDYEGVADVWVIQYEYLLGHGTQHLIDRISEWTGVQPNCEAYPPQKRTQKKSRIITEDFADHIKQHLNWTVESWIGYHA